MIAAGLPLTTAAAYAGARGFAQLGGRLVLVPVVRRIGSPAAIVATYLAGAAGVVALAGSSTTAFAVAATGSHATTIVLSATGFVLAAAAIRQVAARTATTSSPRDETG